MNIFDLLRRWSAWAGILTAVSLSTFFWILADPSIRPTERVMLRGIVHGVIIYGDEDPTKDEREAFVRTRLDLDAQIAGTMNEFSLPTGGHPDLTAEHKVAVARVAALRSLLTRFPARAELYAAILRSEVIGWPKMPHPEDKRFLDDPNARPDTLQTPIPALELSQFDADAQEGMKIDPLNAFFPTMRGVEQAQRNQIGTMTESLHQASRCSRWEDYTRNEITGGWRFDDAKQTSQGALSRAAEQAGVALAHLAPVRHLALTAIGRAADAESQGRVGEGIQLRHAVMRLGALMRVSSTYWIENIVGVVIERISLRSPGGRYDSEPTAMPSEDKARSRAQRYEAWLNGHGAPAEAQWVASEVQNTETTSLDGRETLRYLPSQQGEYDRLMDDWYSSLLSFDQAVCLWVSIGCALIVLGVRKSLGPLLASSRWGITGGLTICGTGLYLLVTMTLLKSPGAQIFSYSCLVSGYLGVGLCSHRLRKFLLGRKPLVIGYGLSAGLPAIAGTAAVVWKPTAPIALTTDAAALLYFFAIIAALIWRARPHRRSWSRAFIALLGTSMILTGAVIATSWLGHPQQDYSVVSGSTEDKLHSEMVLDILESYIPIAVIAVWFALLSGLRRTPLASTLAHSLCTIGVFIACFLTMKHVNDVTITARLDRHIESEQNIIVNSEAHFRELQGHLTLPGITPEPKNSTNI